MLRAAKADALCSEFHSLTGVCRIGAHPQDPILVCPIHDPVKIPADGGLYRGQLLPVDITRASV